MVGTSDVHFNDGYWFATYAPGDWYFVVGLRLHPNTNVIDGFAASPHDGEQRVVRARARCGRATRSSRSDRCAGDRAADAARAPRRWRTSPIDVAFELDVESRGPPFVEEPYRHLKYGDVINDTIRYTQVVPRDGHAALRRATASRSTAGTRCATTRGACARRWARARRHGGIDRTDAEADRRRYRLWVPFETRRPRRLLQHPRGRARPSARLRGPAELPGRPQRRAHRREPRADLRARHAVPTGGAIVLDGATGGASTSSRRRARRPTSRASATTAAGTTAAAPGVYRGDGPHVESDRYHVTTVRRRAGPPHVPDAPPARPDGVPLGR